MGGDLTINLAEVYQTLIIIGGIIGTILAILKPFREHLKSSKEQTAAILKRLELEESRNKSQDKLLIDTNECMRVIVISQLAVLEGMVEQGANHNTKIQYEQLRNYVRNKAYDMDWYLDEKEDK